MGDVIPFAAKRPNSIASGPLAVVDRHIRAIREAVLAGADRSALLTAAQPLLDRCRDRYGFVVMQEGLPQEPALLGRALIELIRALSLLDAVMRAPRTYPTFGVYFGCDRLAWFEDGYSGTTGLSVPSDTAAADLAQFVRPRIAAARSRPHD